MSNELEVQVDSPWTVQEGVVVAYGAKIDDICDYIRSLQVVAEIEWYKQSPHLMGLNVLRQGNQVAQLKRGKELEPGITLAEFADKLSSRFSADVRVGESYSSRLEAGSEKPIPHKDENAKIRFAQITLLPKSSVPFFAAAHNLDLACIELGNGLRCLLFELVGDAYAIEDVSVHPPVVTLSVSARDQRIMAVTDEDNEDENIALHSWLMQTRLVAGGVKRPTDELVAKLRHELGHSTSPEKIAAVHGADAQALKQAFQTPGEKGLLEAIKVLGLPVEVASYLFGQIEGEDIAEAEMYRSPSLVNALGQSLRSSRHEFEEERLLKKLSILDRAQKLNGFIGLGLAIGGGIAALKGNRSARALSALGAFIALSTASYEYVAHKFEARYVYSEEDGECDCCHEA